MLQKQTNNSRFAGIFLLSFATLLLEISLTRVLSVALWYHFGFLVISTALLGFGASGSVLSLWQKLRKEIPLDKAMGTICLGFALSSIVCYGLMQKIPFAPFSLLTDSSQLFFMPLYFFVLSIPFFFSGLGISLLLTRGAEDVNRFYAWDLIGAALGCLAVLVVLPLVGGSGAIFVASAFGALATIPFGFSQYRKLMVLGGSLGLLLLIGAFYGDTLIPIQVTANKASGLASLTPEYSKWNSFSKIDLYNTPADPAEGSLKEKFFVIDRGTALTGISDVSQSMTDLQVGQIAARKMNLRESGIAVLGKRDAHVLVIGSGAGADVHAVLENGATKVTAVEINPLINNYIRTDPFFKPLFDHPAVELVTDEGRSFIKRSSEQYDAIVSTHTITNAAMASGALSLSESYILTKEAFTDYYEHLSPDGALFFTRPEYQIPRLFTTAREVLEEQGVTDPKRYIYAWRFAVPGASSLSFSGGFLMKKSPLTEADFVFMDAGLVASKYDNNRAELLYSPIGRSTHDSLSFKKEVETTLIYQDIFAASELDGFYASQKQEISPTTDNKPFFNHNTRWSNLDLTTITDIFKLEKQGRMALEDRPVSEVTLLVLLIQTILVASLLIIVPLFRIKASTHPLKQGLPYIGYFAGLGMGFILIEIVFLQKFTLYLGQPVYTFASVLAGLLLFTGLGAYFSDRFKVEPYRALRRIIPILLGVLLVLFLAMPYLFQATLHLPIFVRIIISEIMLAPIGVLMGMPFPIGLRVINKKVPDLVPWAWGVNGFFTVIGSILSVILGMVLGFGGVIVIAGCFYAICWLIMGQLEKTENMAQNI